jgi:hypothetical protein
VESLDRLRRVGCNSRPLGHHNMDVSKHLRLGQTMKKIDCVLHALSFVIISFSSL